MTGEHAVPIPGWECTSFQPPSLLVQPGHVPGAILERHAHYRHLDPQRWDFERDTVCRRVNLCGDTAQVGDPVGGKAGGWQAFFTMSGAACAACSTRSTWCTQDKRRSSSIHIDQAGWVVKAFRGEAIYILRRTDIPAQARPGHIRRVGDSARRQGQHNDTEGDFSIATC